uniref:exocyst complex component 3-like protein 4 isoform X1 n=1 Tax=Oncorhynchus gorbuscha TaxID=8017 RepID=UPI001EAF81B3|nr:exocyst complex component 3-like protein 4 isoform X1 [Oncorhynchus gorbuscha]XP_046165487.1 exocyst complex component 3-like protein 4 isoform X1 [Oncorhynchus gorbuscha]XP_046165490.1 exocyst complex component 3-like protein 4 isoform X1 [Oncorhynchus gorbuscha]
MASGDQTAEIGEPGNMEEVNEAQGLEDGPSLKSTMERNGKTQPDSPVKEKKLGMMKQFRESMKRVGERSPLASNSKGSKDRPYSDQGGDSIDPEVTSLTHQLPPTHSPSLSAGSPVASPLKSPDPSTIGDSLLKKGASIRRSLRLAGNKKDKTLKQEPLQSVTEITVEEKREKKKEEINESYILPEIPLIPPSGLSAGSPVGSPLKSPVGFFQIKEGGEIAEDSPSSQKKHSRTHSDPSTIGDSLLKKGASIRRSFRLAGNKKDKTLKQEQLQSVTEITVEEKRAGEESVEIKESYILPEIPLTPLSVMQINELIKTEVLEEAHLNLLSLRQEFQRERDECTEEASPMELAKKEKDLSILYIAMQEKVKEIVRNSNSLPSLNKELLMHVARVIQEEEKREAEPGGVVGLGDWRGAWREAVSEGVEATLKRVPLDRPEQNASWLAIHLGLLGKAILKDLEKVKRELQGSYPPSFNVFSTYMSCYHGAVSQHLNTLQQQVTDLKDYYALLDWIINRYESENIMSSPSLRPEIEAEKTGLSLEEGFLDQLKGKYCMRAKEDMRASLDKILELENEDIWIKKQAPETDDEHFLNSDIHMDIWTNVKSNAVNSKRIDVNLEMRVVCSCLEELQQFPKRFETKLRYCCNSVENPSLWADYQITYINSFTALMEHMEGYRESCPTQVDHLSREVDGLVHRLVQSLEDQFKNDVRPYLRRMMTRKWLSTDEDFQQLYSRTEKLTHRCSQMRPPYVQTFLSCLHYYVVKEYVSQLMKNNYSCKNRKHDKAATKMRAQWDKLKDLFEEMTTHDWLHPVGDHLSNIIGETNKRDIKKHLELLVADYPDISKKHLSAVLYFRGLMRGRERQVILQRLTELKRELGTAGNIGDNRRALFSDMQVTVTNTDCLADIPLFCFLLPDS